MRQRVRRSEGEPKIKTGISKFTSREDLGATTEETVTGLEAATKLRERTVKRTTMLHVDGAMAVDRVDFAKVRLRFQLTCFPSL